MDAPYKPFEDTPAGAKRPDYPHKPFVPAWNSSRRRWCEPLALSKMKVMDQRKEIDYVIIGAGPAGLQLAYFLEKAGRDYLILDAGDRPGEFFERFPRHGKLISINKVHTGYTDRESQLRYDWNSLISDDPELAFTRYTSEYFADTKLYAKYLRDYAERLGLKIQFQTRVSEVRPADGQGGANYVVADSGGDQYACRALIVATGLTRPFVPDIPGIEHTENYWDCPIEPEDFAGQKLLIIGKGNSAFETANHLVGATRVTHVCSPNPIKMAWKTHFFGHLRAVNNDFLDTYILKGQNSVLDATIDKIERDGDELVVDVTFTHAQGQCAKLAYDRVITCTGFAWNPAFFGDAADGAAQPASTACGRLPSMTSAWESTNLPHVYYAGTLMQMRDLHKTMSNVLHGFRFNVKSLASILEHRYEGAEWPGERLPRDAEAIADKVIERVSTNAGLMHQPGFLSDVLVIDDHDARYYDTVSVDYVHDSHFGRNPHYYTITMEYGDTLDEVLCVHREPDPNKAYNDFYLHPRIQRFAGGEKLAEHHISESLENEWRLEQHPGEKPLIRQISFHGQEDDTQYQRTHRDQLVAFFHAQLAGGPTNGQPPADNLAASPAGDSKA
ncbi:MAG: NAD(P)-binding domain-containing protein [Planctomycetota bacterium]